MKRLARRLACWLGLHDWIYCGTACECRLCPACDLLMTDETAHEFDQLESK